MASEPEVTDIVRAASQAACLVETPGASPDDIDPATGQPRWMNFTKGVQATLEAADAGQGALRGMLEAAHGVGWKHAVDEALTQPVATGRLRLTIASQSRPAEGVYGH